MSQTNKTMKFQYIHTEFNGKRRVPVAIDVEYICTFDDFTKEVKSADIEEIKIDNSQCLYDVFEQTNWELLQSIKEAAMNHAIDTIDQQEEYPDPFRQDIFDNYNVQK
jgi:hypothetical protein